MGGAHRAAELSAASSSSISSGSRIAISTEGQLPDESYIERLFPKCPPKAQQQQQPHYQSNGSKTKVRLPRSRRKQSKAKLEQQTRAELAANQKQNVKTNSNIKSRNKNNLSSDSSDNEKAKILAKEGGGRVKVSIPSSSQNNSGETTSCGKGSSSLKNFSGIESTSLPTKIVATAITSQVATHDLVSEASDVAIDKTGQPKKGSKYMASQNLQQQLLKSKANASNQNGKNISVDQVSSPSAKNQKQPENATQKQSPRSSVQQTEENVANLQPTRIVNSRGIVRSVRYNDSLETSLPVVQQSQPLVAAKEKLEKGNYAKKVSFHGLSEDEHNQQENFQTQNTPSTLLTSIQSARSLDHTNDERAIKTKKQTSCDEQEEEISEESAKSNSIKQKVELNLGVNMVDDSDFGLPPNVTEQSNLNAASKSTLKSHANHIVDNKSIAEHYLNPIEPAQRQTLHQNEDAEMQSEVDDEDQAYEQNGLSGDNGDDFNLAGNSIQITEIIEHDFEDPTEVSSGQLVNDEDNWECKVSENVAVVETIQEERPIAEVVEINNDASIEELRNPGDIFEEQILEPTRDEKFNWPQAIKRQPTARVAPVSSLLLGLQTVEETDEVPSPRLTVDKLEGNNREIEHNVLGLIDTASQINKDTTEANSMFPSTSQEAEPSNDQRHLIEISPEPQGCSPTGSSEFQVPKPTSSTGIARNRKVRPKKGAQPSVMRNQPNEKLNGQGFEREIGYSDADADQLEDNLNKMSLTAQVESRSKQEDFYATNGTVTKPSSTVSSSHSYRHRKVPNETSHFSIVPQGSQASMRALPELNLAPRSSSMQFNTLSEGDSELEMDNNESKQPYLEPDSPSSYQKVSNKLPSSSKHSIKPIIKGAKANNSSKAIQDDDDQTPTTKTALIFPRLDEGLSSEAESCDDEALEENDSAQEADVDADDDEFEDEEEEDDEDDDGEDEDDDIEREPDLEEDGVEGAGILSHNGGTLLKQISQHPNGIGRRSAKSLQRHDNSNNTHSERQVSLLELQDPNSSLQSRRVRRNLSSSNNNYNNSQSVNNYMNLHENQPPFDRNNVSGEIKSTAGSYYANHNGSGGQQPPNSYWMNFNNQANNDNTAGSLQQVTSSTHQQQPQPYGAGNHKSARNNNLIPGTSKDINSYGRDDVDPANNRALISSDTDNETDRLLGSQRQEQSMKLAATNASNSTMNSNGSHLNQMVPSTSSDPLGQSLQKNSSSKEVLIEGILFNVKYLGSTHSDCEGSSDEKVRIKQAQTAVRDVKRDQYRNGDPQPAVEVQLFISTEKIMVLDDKNRKIMMDHSLRTISYIADIGEAIVLIVMKRSNDSGGQQDLSLAGCSGTGSGANNASCNVESRHLSRISCHVFESPDSSTITKSISQAFQVAYTELRKASGANDSSGYLPKELDYQDVLNSQEMSTDELEMFSRRDKQREVIVPKEKGEILGLSIVESGWGSVLPTVVIASLKSEGPAYRCKKLSVGDQILSVNGISLVGLPLKQCQDILRKTRKQRVARLSVVPCPITVEVKIKRPDTKYQLGFSVQNGVICSLLRGGIAERGGVRVGHRIMSINGTTVVGVPHEKIVTLLASSVGEIRMKTCLTSLYRLILGEDSPVHL